MKNNHPPEPVHLSGDIKGEEDAPKKGNGVTVENGGGGKRILVAGIGNIFYRDDAFGCEVVRQLKLRDLPEDVTVTDFGIRSFDLAYALMDNFDTIILVDATPRGQAPGMLYLTEPDLGELENIEATATNAHRMNPVSVIRMARSHGGIGGKLFFVGCEPEVLEDESGEIGLSKKVQEAVPEAVAMIESLIAKLLGTESQNQEMAIAC
jgi:hydrogenase maturation protease